MKVLSRKLIYPDLQKKIQAYCKQKLNLPAPSLITMYLYNNADLVTNNGSDKCIKNIFFVLNGNNREKGFSSVFLRQLHVVYFVQIRLHKPATSLIFNP